MDEHAIMNVLYQRSCTDCVAVHNKKDLQGVSKAITLKWIRITPPLIKPGQLIFFNMIDESSKFLFIKKKFTTITSELNTKLNCFLVSKKNHYTMFLLESLQFLSLFWTLKRPDLSLLFSSEFFLS